MPGVLNMPKFWIWQGSQYEVLCIVQNMLWQSSQYILGSKYDMILNIAEYVWIEPECLNLR